MSAFATGAQRQARYTSDHSVAQPERFGAYADSIFVAGPEGVDVLNTSGVVKQSLSCEQTYGAPTSLSTSSSSKGHEFLVVSMAGSYVMLWRLGGREAKKVRRARAGRTASARACPRARPRTTRRRLAPRAPSPVRRDRC